MAGGGVAGDVGHAGLALKADQSVGIPVGRVDATLFAEDQQAVGRQQGGEDEHDGQRLDRRVQPVPGLDGFEAGIAIAASATR